MSRYHRADQPSDSGYGTRTVRVADHPGAPGDHATSETYAPRDNGERALRRLKIIGIVLPVTFIVGIEFIRFNGIGHPVLHVNEHLLLGAVTVSSVIAFGSVMFYLIDRAHRVVLRQNRELAAVNAVSTAVRGNLDVNQIIDAALTNVLHWTGACEASVTAADPSGRPPHEAMATWRRIAGVAGTTHTTPPHPAEDLPAGPPSAVDVPAVDVPAVDAPAVDAPAGDLPAGPAGAAAGPPVVDIPLTAVDIPLTTGSNQIGTMRLTLPRDQRPDGLSSDTLRNIGQQVGSALQSAQFVADLQRRKHEGHALYDVLLKISHQSSPVDTLMPVVRYARDLLGGDEAVLCLNEATSRFVEIDGALGVTASGGPVCIAPGAAEVRANHAHSCPIRSSTEFRATLTVPLDGPGGPFGKLWVARRSATPFTDRDEGYLVTLSEIAVIAISSARMRENERQGAILSERDRIAREMHDSLAQVLGVTHLRLHALNGRTDIREMAAVRGELAELADICRDAYGDVREAILGLRESTRTDRALLESLRAYLAKFSRQSGIDTSLDSTVGDDLVLTPRSEIHLIRVVQEALTNVRKHSGARSAVVRVTSDGSTVTFVVEDDGHGFDMTEVPPDRDGFGLHSMAERMRLLNGSLTIDSMPGRGTRVIAALPEPARAAIPTQRVGGVTADHPVEAVRAGDL